MRVYMIEVDDKGSDDYTDEEFITLAEEQGTVYTIKGFQNAFNYEDCIGSGSYIRFLEVFDPAEDIEDGGMPNNEIGGR